MRDAMALAILGVICLAVWIITDPIGAGTTLRMFFLSVKGLPTL